METGYLGLPKQMEHNGRDFKKDKIKKIDILEVNYCTCLIIINKYEMETYTI